MPIKTQSAKAKGRKLQQYVCKLLTEVLKLEDGDAESRSMGSSGVDVILSPAARRAAPFSLECKKTKKTPSVSELRQAQCNCKPGTLGGVVWQPHGKGEKDTMIMFDLREFMEFWRDHGD